MKREPGPLLASERPRRRAKPDAAIAPREAAPAHRLLARLRALPLATQFLLAASGVVFLLMTVLSIWMVARIESAGLRGAGAAGALHLQTFVTPLLTRDASGAFVMTQPLEERLDGLLGTGPIGQHIFEIKIWRPDGTLFYSSSGHTIQKPVVFPELKAATAGETIVSRTEIDKHEYQDSERETIFIEVYTPLVKGPDGKAELIGEFYEQPEYLEAELRSAERAAVLVIGGMSIPMLGLLYLIVRGGGQVIERQQRALTASLRNAIELSVENNRLRLSAEHARVEAGKLNERILDQIGSDLHDGPVQLLTLVKLRLSDLLPSMSPAGAPPTTGKLLDLVSAVLDELRNISSGLVLPELEATTIGETIQLAVKRFTEISGHAVEVDGIADSKTVTPDLNICVYRFVLEALMNSFRHAPGNAHKVRFRLLRGRLFLQVADRGSGRVLQTAREVERARLGKTSQKRRIRSFGGRMRYFRRRSGTIAIACLPLAAG